MPRFIYHSPSVIASAIKREIKDEMRGSEKYMDLVDQLEGLKLQGFIIPQEFVESVFEMARDESRHAGRLQKILNYMMSGEM